MNLGQAAWLQRRNSSSAKHSCMAGLTLILVISHDYLIVSVLPEGRFVVSALCTWQQRSNGI